MLWRSDWPWSSLCHWVDFIFDDAINWNLYWLLLCPHAFWLFSFFKSLYLGGNCWRQRCIICWNYDICQVRWVPWFWSMRSSELVSAVYCIWILAKCSELLFLVMRSMVVVKCPHLLLLEIYWQLVICQVFGLLRLNHCKLLCCHVIICINKTWSLKVLELELCCVYVGLRIQLQLSKFEVAIASLFKELLWLWIVY